MRHVLVLFPDEWDHAAAAGGRYDDRYRFHFEGFDLFRFPDNARLFTFRPLAFVERLVRRYRGRVDAVVTSDEQFGPFLAALVGERLGVPHASLQAVLALQHKFYARQAFGRIAPEANARYGLIRRDYSRPEDVPLPFPFYVKPAKAAFSVLARRVDSFEALRRHTRFGWFEGAIIDRLVAPFGEVMRACSTMTEHPFSMVAEEILHGPQVTACGFVREGRARVVGCVDSIMYPGTDQFQRFQYPSALPADTLGKAEALAVRLLEGVGFGHGFFNVEMRIDPHTGEPRVIEVNPRAAGQFYDLFERVDGYSGFEAMLELALGEEPTLRHREGRQAHAASFVLRDLTGEGLSRWPAAGTLERLRERHPDAHIMVYPKRGADLAREMKWLGSYRYGVFNLGGTSREALFNAFERICRDIDFHPRGYRPPDGAPALEGRGDD